MAVALQAQLLVRPLRSATTWAHCPLHPNGVDQRDLGGLLQESCPATVSAAHLPTIDESRDRFFRFLAVFVQRNGSIAKRTVVARSALLVPIGVRLRSRAVGVDKSGSGLNGPAGRLASGQASRRIASLVTRCTWTRIRPSTTPLPASTSQQSVPSPRIARSETPLITDSSTVATPSRIRPAAGIRSPASTRTTSPSRKAGATVRSMRKGVRS